jgi:hypothetical protein
MPHQRKSNGMAEKLHQEIRSAHWKAQFIENEMMIFFSKVNESDVGPDLNPMCLCVQFVSPFVVRLKLCCCIRWRVRQRHSRRLLGE